MKIVKIAVVSLIFIISVSRINGQMGITIDTYPNLTEFRNLSNLIVYNVVGNSTHLYDVVKYPEFNSPRDQFLNKTLSRISSGVCIEEVPTASLIKDHRYGIPRGNGSTPTMSRIQVCCEGYKRNAHILRKCDPICNEECVNGICVAPNQCECYPDHVKDLAGNCVPTCPAGCLNGECNSNECICQPGYQLEPNQNVCVPRCSQGCIHGICTEPDVCICKTGYQMVKGRCSPICEGGCEFGYCIAPGQCSCLTGYKMTLGRCEPICISGCNNGRCARPDVCECNPGWSVDATGENCVPGCSQPCLNGVCSAAGTCQCNRGYVADNNDPFKCIAHCPNGCPNGICSAPNLCLCNLGFVKDRSVRGSQNCVPRSINGQIGIKTAPLSIYPNLTEFRNSSDSIVYNVVGNSTHFFDVVRYPQFNSTKDQFLNRTLSHISTGVCVKEVPTASLIEDPRNGIPIGNGSTPAMSRIQVCCEGYQRNAHILRQCDPICNQECVNGICVAPNQCECYPDHVKNLAGYCVSTCPIGCLNGECNSNECVCKPGYQLEPNRNFCVPRCSQSCMHGNCTEPNVCSCKTGYQMEQGKCSPICEGGCEFGNCIAPGQCSCLAGYKMTLGKCEPICTSGCNNGRCAKPNVCECNAGWTIDATGSNCVPGCSRPCLNGVCSAADTCQCHRGYVADNNDPFKCIAHCPNGCPNGVCSAPNFCLCNLGFVKDRSVKGSQNCVPRV